MTGAVYLVLLGKMGALQFAVRAFTAGRGL